jgi:small subunit ribosomal protein S3
LRADIDYGFREARTSTGRIGVKVWIYKGDILPYSVTADEKIVREAALAVGDAVPSAPAAPRGVVRAGGGRRRVGEGVETEAVVEAPVAAPTELLSTADDLEKRLSQEEDIERRTAGDHSETPNFRKDVD